MNKHFAAALALMLSAGAAHAADVFQPQPEPLMDAPEITVQESTGWYLRGDVGYSFNKMRGAEYFQGSNDTLVDFDRTDLKDSLLLGIGVGYQINSMLRTDLTFDHIGKSDFSGSTTGLCGTVTCTSSDRSEMNAYSLMANVYVDLGTYGHITPYVGAGFGGSYVKWDRLRNTICGTDGCDTTEHDGKGKWRFSYALMAGATIDVTCNWQADIGYRYRRIGGGDMFGYNLGGGPGEDKGFESHEARVGARYNFGACDVPPVYQPEPIVYK